jgi:hypothetical protein
MDDNNIEDYTPEELLQILQIEQLTRNNIVQQTNFYIEKYATTNTNLSLFFREAQKKLLGFIESETSLDDDWRDNEYLTQNDQTKNEKITNRPQSSEIYNENEHIIMKRKLLGINQNYDVPVAHGTLNPILKNTFSRIVNIDSQFRQNNVPSIKGINKYADITAPIHISTWSSTDFSLDLSDSLTNVISLKLYSLQIPFTWYNIIEGLNCFTITCTDTTPTPTIITVTVTPGNYTATTIATAINTQIINCLGTDDDDPIVFSYNSETGKFDINLPPLPHEITITFWDGINQCNSTEQCKVNPKVNNNLGWLLGFRDPSYTITSSPIISAESVPNLTGTKYIIIVLDDFNTNRINKGLVTIQDTETRLSLPKYYQPGNVSQMQVTKPYCIPPDTSGNYQDHTYVSTPVYSQGTPPIITQKQQYSVNEIIKNRKNVTSEKITPPSTTNVFAIIPIKSSEKQFGELITELSGPLSLNIRNYFGPVDIERMKVTLYDDKGNILNLNGADWSFTMISEHLYKY